MYFLKVEKVTKRFGGVVALNDVSAAFERGEIHSIVGENGAGKSTLLKILSGTVKADDGDVYLEGEKITNLEPLDLFGLGISVAFQETSLFDNLNVAENLFIGELYKYNRFKVNWNEAVEMAGKILTDFGLKDISPSAQVASLSAGEKQIIEILKAVKTNAKIICMDEPTAPLTKDAVELLFSLLNRLKATKITIIYVSHNIEEVLRISDRITVLRDGKKIDTVEKKDASDSILHDLMIGRSITKVRKIKEKTFKEDEVPVLKLVNVGDGEKVKDISFEVMHGEIVGITGLVGAGRSELAWLLFGLRPKTSGKIYVKGKELPFLTPDLAIREGILYLPEDRRQTGIFLNQNLLINTTVSKLEKIRRGVMLDFKGERDKTRIILDKLNVKYSTLNQSALQLSGGNQQKLLFAKCLFADPEILILDEPTKGIDVGSKQEIYKLIRDLAREGMAVVLISSEVEEICLLSDRVLVMGHGKILGVFEGEKINERDITTCYLQAAKSK